MIWEQPWYVTLYDPLQLKALILFNLFNNSFRWVMMMMIFIYFIILGWPKVSFEFFRNMEKPERTFWPTQ